MERRNVAPQRAVRPGSRRRRGLADSPSGGDEMADPHEPRSSEESYRSALEIAGHVYFEFDPRSRRTVAGAPWTVLGYRPDELSPSIDAWMELVHPEDRAPLIAGMQRQHHGPS